MEGGGCGPSLIRYSAKTAEQNFRNCSIHDAILHLLFQIFIRMILGFPRTKQGLCHYDIKGGGTHLWSATPLRPLNRILWNFQELFTTWCHTAPPILNFYLHDFGVSQNKTSTLQLRHINDFLHVVCAHIGYEQLLITNICIFYFVNANVVHELLHVVVTGMMDCDQGKAGSGTYLIFDRRDFVARPETMSGHVFIPPQSLRGYIVILMSVRSFVCPSLPISNPLLLLDRWTKFHETFRNCSLHDAILHLLF